MESGRSPFVGRTEEEALLEAWRHEAWAGSLRIALLSGPAGIGKTRLLAQVMAKAAAAGATVAAGTCAEDMPVPYLPLASALRGLPGAAAALTPLLDPAAPAGPPTSGNAALFLAAAGAVLDAAAAGPLLLAIDDLHWADPASLGLLEHILVACCSEATHRPVHLLVVLSTRPDAAGRAGHVLQRLAREPAVRPLDLPGLDEPAVNELLAHHTGRVPARQELRQVIEATGGNPLLVLSCSDGSGRPSPTWRPTDLDAALAKRLERLNGDAATVVIMTALLNPNPETSWPDLAAATGFNPDALDRAIAVATNAGVLASGGGFEHPQLRRLVLARIPPARQAELHAVLADRLEEAWREDGEKRALELAHHLRLAGNRVDSARVQRWCELAGEQAMALAAWDQAAVLFEAACEAARPASARLMTRTATAHFRNLDLAAAIERAAVAVAAAERDRDLDTWVDAGLVLVRARMSSGAEVIGQHLDTSSLERWLEAADPKAPRRPQVLELLAETEFNRFAFDQGRVLASEAIALAEAVGDQATAAQAAFALGLQHMGLLQLSEACDAFAIASAAAMRADDTWYRPWGPNRTALAKAVAGQLDAARDHREVARAAAMANHEWSELSLAAGLAAQLAVAQGDLAAAERSGTEAFSLFLRSEYGYTLQIAQPAVAAARALAGDLAGAHHAIDAATDAGSRGLRWWHALIDALGGDLEAARTAVRARPWSPPPEAVSLFGLGRVAGGVELAGLLGLVDLAAAQRRALDDAVRAGAVFTPDGALFLPRLQAVAARLEGRLDDARRLAAAGLDLAERAGAVLEAARTRLELAALAVAAGEADETVRGWARPAVAALDRVGALALLAPARRLAGDVDVAERVVLMTDLVESTPLLLKAGEHRWREVLEGHDRAMRALLTEEGGTEIRQTGDGICAWFGDADAAVRCALRVSPVLRELSRRHQDVQLVPRCGVASGPFLVENGMAVGAAIHLAARVCSLAGAEEVKVTGPVAAHAASGTARFVAEGEVRLKGFPDPVAILAAVPG